MPRLEVRAFSDDYLGDAARLLAARHARHRAAEPLLSERYEEPGAAREQLEGLWHRDDASGWAGFRDGQLAAYIVGTVHERVHEGHVWIDYAGHAVEDAEDIRDLYAAAAAQWVDEGRPQHYVQVPAHDAALIDSWFRLSFGQQQVDGARDVPARTEVRLPDAVEIRAPTADDVEALLAVDLALPRQHRASPVFSTRPLPTEDELRAEWQRTLAAGEETLFVGCHHERPVACWSLVKRAQKLNGLVAPDDACFLHFAATIPEARWLGIGVALTDTALAWAASEGCAAMATDWRVTNLLASRFWPRRGFRPTFLRLYRHIP
jgi:ribosomal protein S18 acetylase RimI-like enzyme